MEQTPSRVAAQIQERMDAVERRNDELAKKCQHQEERCRVLEARCDSRAERTLKRAGQNGHRLLMTCWCARNCPFRSLARVFWWGGHSVVS